ncbi:uncharacterized protein E0L32_011846 [Thyridium curvatum]|uniref:Calcium-transporting ATPase n=1 Tax=Thyridium curvatum TaxID=1093900 RepID=A0A507BFE8_9PEZI|nr:uncharacterized protein E0L32_011846 [Thyridium curvatum]TPX18076.1 hypothetical protein E0L32_011846 [Thyridium curvatum]
MDPPTGEESAPTRRPRAPTITIDTTAVNPDTHANMDQPGAPNQAESTHSQASPTDENHSPVTTIDPSSWSGSQRTARGYSGSSGRPQLQQTPSFESDRSRPTSPHNISSPVTSRGNDQNHNFLSVPHNPRSRQNSVDSDDGSRSVAMSQGETVVGSASQPGDKPKLGRTTSQDLSNDKIMNDADALKPDKGKEEDFVANDSPFAFSVGQLNKMFNPKSLSAFYKMGGLRGLEKGLQSDRRAGLSSDEVNVRGRVTFDEATGSAEDKEVSLGIDNVPSPTTPTAARTPTSKPGGERFVDRKRVYKDNRLPEKKAKSLLQLVWITFNDKILILLSIAAAVSLAVGLYQTFGGEHKPGEPKVEWIEGVAIIVAITIVVIVGSLNDWQKERQFAKLNKKKTDRLVKVIRSGKTQEISVYDILVGDVLHLETGDLIPVDGVLIEGHNIKCDESQTTGESDLIKKRASDEVYAAIENHDSLKKMDPFIQSGARVMEGLGTFLVTSTGVNSSYGRTLMSLHDDPEITPLQMKLNVIADYIAKLGGASALLLFVVLFIEFCARLPKLPPDVTPAQKGQDFLTIFIVVITIIVVAVPEGLPLAVTLALSYATKKMVKENNLVRQLKACEVMGNATTICSDKTGTLTQNKMLVVAGTIGTAHRFGGIQPADEEQTPASPEDHRDLSANEFTSILGADVRDLLLKSIALNSTAFEGDVDGRMTFIGSKTESALLIFAKEHLAMGPVAEERSNAKILQLIPFDSGRKCMGVVVALPDGKARLYVKGASEIMVEYCTQILRDPSKDISACQMTEENKETIAHLIEQYASSSLRTIGIIYRDFEQWPPRRLRRADRDSDEVPFEQICKDMIFIGMVGIKDPLREGVREAVKDCQRAGVVVRMVTGDNRLTAKAIAEDCGILQPDSIVMDGPEFRNLTKSQQEEIIPRLHVLARSSPEDKRILVKRLKEKGETVAVTGDGTNDAPALKMADVGFSMGITGTEVAKEASAIILMDDNFNSIVNALKWGRAVNDAVKRFLQFQLTVNVTAVVLTFVSAVSSHDETSVLTAVQLLWVNLIMDTLAALALATDPPHPSVLDKKPERKGSGIISTTMWKMIIGQAIYQLAITFLLYFGKQNVLPDYDDNVTDAQVQALVFNTFVWMQIFNQWNNRRLDNRFNIFEGLSKNMFFPVISIIMCGGQALIIQFGDVAFNIPKEKQTGAQWAYAIVLGFISIPIGMVIRMVPDPLVERLIPDYLKRRAHTKIPGVTVSDDDERFAYYPPALDDVRDELAWLKRYKGGRLNNLKFAMKHPKDFMSKSRSPTNSRSPSRDHSRSNSVHAPQTPTREDSLGSVMIPTPDSRKRSRSMRSRSNSALGAPTVMAGIIAGSVAAGWSPIDRVSGERDFGSQISRTPSPLVTRDDDQGQQSSNVLGEGSFTEEPQEIPSAAKDSSDVPRLSVPQPPHHHHNRSPPPS